MSLSGKHFAIMGLARSGIQTAIRLLDDNAHVYGWDDNEEQRQNAQDHNIPITDLTHDAFWEKHDLDALVLAPGIPHKLPTPNSVATLASQHNVPIISDVSLLPYYQPSSTYIGITGTNGKSTTTALLNHCLQKAGVDSCAGGNLGIPVLQTPSASTYVLEISSYMAERLNNMHFHIGLLMNLTTDHLERHGDMQGYLNAKLKMFQGGDNANKTALVVIDDIYCQQAYEHLQSQGIKTIAISAHNPVKGGVYLKGTTLIDHMHDNPISVLDTKDYPNLLGTHNSQNMMAVYACMRCLGIDHHVIKNAFHSFTALPHRQQLVDTINHIQFVNDSKGSNVDAVINALNSYETIYWIAGGQGKQGGYDTLASCLKPIIHSYLIGESQDEIATFLKRQNQPYTLCETLNNAVMKAYKDALKNALPNSVILLSPACASWDQFKNFEHRGNTFIDCVKALKQDSLP